MAQPVIGLPAARPDRRVSATGRRADLISVRAARTLDLRDQALHQRDRLGVADVDVERLLDAQEAGDTCHHHDQRCGRPVSLVDPVAREDTKLLKVDGFASATRYESVDGDGFLAIYELDVEPETAKANQSAAQASGTMTPPAGLRLDPPPTVRYYLAR